MDRGKLTLGLVACLLMTAPASAMAADTVPPTVNIVSGPGAGGASAITTDEASTFRFESNEPVASYSCSFLGGKLIDGPPPFGECSGPGAIHSTGPLTEGLYFFAVRAKDLAGNMSGYVFVEFFVARPPDARIAKHPKKRSRSRATFRFGFNDAQPFYDPERGFECRVDGGPYKGCTSPLQLNGLDPGKHRLAVRAIRLVFANKIVDKSPAIFRWRVVD